MLPAGELEHFLRAWQAWHMYKQYVQPATRGLNHSRWNFSEPGFLPGIQLTKVSGRSSHASLGRQEEAAAVKREKTITRLQWVGIVQSIIVTIILNRRSAGLFSADSFIAHHGLTTQSSPSSILTILTEPSFYITSPSLVKRERSFGQVSHHFLSFAKSSGHRPDLSILSKNECIFLKK